MLKQLIKKQTAEIFRAYLYDYKKNRPRSRASTILMFALFVLIMAGMIGGMFTFLSIQVVPLAQAGLGWLYYLLVSSAAVILGVIGSVFNTYSGVYLAKDNELLLSMPIKPKTIVTSRLVSVYLMGALYSLPVMIPAVAVCFVMAPQNAASVIGAIVLTFFVTVIDFILSCALGWVVAKISRKLKNRSIVTVIIALAGLVLYYVIYFKAMDAIRDLLANASLYGEKIKGAAYPVYLFGRIGDGDVISILIFGAIFALLTASILIIMFRTFIGIATASSTAAPSKVKNKSYSEKGAFGALLSKELRKIKSSPSYMLNGALGTVMMPVLGIFILIKGGDIAAILPMIEEPFPGGAAVAICAVICLIASMNMISAPSISLEGGTLWILKTVPVDARSVLLSKYMAHFILTAPPALFLSVCASLGLGFSGTETVFIILIPLLFAALSAGIGLVFGLMRPNLNWTREIVVIKQSVSVLVTMLSGFGLSALIGILYFALLSGVGCITYLSVVSVILLVSLTVVLKYITGGGAAKFSAL